MSKPTREELQQAFLAFRRAHDLRAAFALMKKVGGVDDLDKVEESKWPALIAAFNEGATIDGDESKPRKSQREMPIATIHAKLEEMRAGVFRRWNTRRRRD